MFSLFLSRAALRVARAGFLTFLLMQRPEEANVSEIQRPLWREGATLSGEFLFSLSSLLKLFCSLAAFSHAVGSVQGSNGIESTGDWSCSFASTTFFSSRTALAFSLLIFTEGANMSIRTSLPAIFLTNCFETKLKLENGEKVNEWQILMRKAKWEMNVKIWWESGNHEEKLGNARARSNVWRYVKRTERQTLISVAALYLKITSYERHVSRLWRSRIFL